MQGRESSMPAVELWESFFDPAAIVAALGASSIEGDVVEFGCGYGTFTVPFARGTSGQLYALDIDPAMVAATAERAQRESVRNVVVEERDFVVAGSGRPADSVSFALLFNILHIEEPVGLLDEARRVLCRGGRVGVTHWIHDARTPRGPPLAMRPRPEQCVEWGRLAGLSPVWQGALPGAPWHFGLVLERR